MMIAKTPIATVISKLLVAAAFSTVLAGAAVAGPKAELPKDLPPYAPDGVLPVADIAQKTLANGMTVWVVPRNGLPRVDYVLAMRGAGFAADAADTPAFATMLAGLLTEGTAQRDSKAIAEAAQSFGGSVGAGADNDGVTLFGNALSFHREGMLGLLADVARQPSFPEKEVKLAQANALQGLKAAESQPGFKAMRALLAATYGGHPYARTQPTEAGIAAVTHDQLRSEHARRFRPERALLVIAGKVTPAEGFALAERAFGDWKGTGTAPAAVAPARRDAKPAHVLIQRDGSVQSSISLGRPAIPATDTDYIPARLTGIVLGGGLSSRVMRNLREDKGYTYGANAGLSASQAGGRISADADVRNEVTGAAIKEFFHEFDRLGNEPMPATELEDTKRYVAGGYLITNQLQGAVAATLADNWLSGLPAEYLGEYVPKVRAVDAAQVQAMARKYYAPRDQSIIVVGDGKAVAEQLKPYGEFERRDN